MKSKIYYLFLSLFLQGCYTTHWVGAFPETEIIYRFEDVHGKPVEGVVLEVVSQAGKVSFSRPIYEYNSQGSVKSDANGFIYVSHKRQGKEFGGECKNILGMEWGACSSPEYILNFYAEGILVLTQKYSEISHLGKRVTIEKPIYTKN